MSKQHASGWLTDRRFFPEDRVSYSILKEMRVSPAAALYKKRNPAPPTPAMEFGKAVDAILFNHKEMVACHPTLASTRTKEFAKAKEDYKREVPDGVYLDAATWEEAVACVAAIRSTPFWHQHFVDADYSTPGVFCAETQTVHNGIATIKQQNVVGIIDAIQHDGHGTPIHLWDLKIVADPTPHAFRNQIDRMRWDLQAAVYQRLMSTIENRQLPFGWLAVRSSEPFICQAYEMDDAWLAHAQEELEALIWDWHEWKDQEIDGETLCIALDNMVLFEPPWRIHREE